MPAAAAFAQLMGRPHAHPADALEALDAASQKAYVLRYAPNGNANAPTASRMNYLQARLRLCKRLMGCPGCLPSNPCVVCSCPLVLALDLFCGVADMTWLRSLFRRLRRGRNSGSG